MNDSTFNFYDSSWFSVSLQLIFRSSICWCVKISITRTLLFTMRKFVLKKNACYTRAKCWEFHQNKRQAALSIQHLRVAAVDRKPPGNGRKDAHRLLAPIALRMRSVIAHSELYTFRTRYSDFVTFLDNTPLCCEVFDRDESFQLFRKLSKLFFPCALER